MMDTDVIALIHLLDPVIENLHHYGYVFPDPVKVGVLMTTHFWISIIRRGSE
jgi:hypothetical protein